MSEVNYGTGDLCLTGLSAARDIKVSVVSCKEIVQETLMRQDLSPQTAKALGELMVCGLLMGLVKLSRYVIKLLMEEYALLFI